jgi:hypothetical protein
MELSLTVVSPGGAETTESVTLTGVEGAFTDADADSQTPADGDCDDNNPTVFTGATEACDGADTNCDGLADNADLDGDGFIDVACTAYVGSTPGDDCDDNNPGTNPQAPELEDGVDNDCDGEVDNGTGNYDDDGDCVCENVECFGSITDGCLLSSGDCNDADATVSPIAEELCDPVDNDCNGVVADRDVDLDGFVDQDCADFFDGNAADCRDDDSAINPLAIDLPDFDDAFADTNCDFIDGNASDAVFVTTNGSSQADCSIDAPCNHLERALQQAQTLGKSQVLIEVGQYSGTNTELTTDLVLAGAYDLGFFVRDVSDETATILSGPVPLLSVASTTVTLQSMTLSPSTTSRTEDATLVMTASSTVTLDNVQIQRASADSGSNGSPGIAGWTSSAPDGNDGFQDRVRDGDTNPGVVNPDCLGSINTRTSGFGGFNGTPNEAGGRGGPSRFVLGSTVYSGGLGGEPNRAGQHATNGHGTGGAGGSAQLVWNGVQLTGGSGADGRLGTNGTHGRGGGGAGDGGGGFGLRRGSQGGSGGAYGCPAQSPGTSGERGLSTIGIQVYDSTLTIRTASAVVGGTGGTGGTGGNGALGQPGGTGGASHGGSSVTWPSGAGGNGGDGGASGGGGGGAGGNIYGVWLIGDSELNALDPLTIEPGLPGLGGLGGSTSLINFPAPGIDGADGLSIEQLIED